MGKRSRSNYKDEILQKSSTHWLLANGGKVIMNKRNKLKRSQPLCLGSNIQRRHSGKPYLVI